MFGVVADPGRLPLRQGSYAYVPPTGDEPVKAQGEGGFVDHKDNVWKWARRNNQAGFCEHWDVEHPNGKHSNITPEGDVHHRTPYDECF